MYTEPNDNLGGKKQMERQLKKQHDELDAQEAQRVITAQQLMLRLRYLCQDMPPTEEPPILLLLARQHLASDLPLALSYLLTLANVCI